MRVFKNIFIGACVSMSEPAYLAVLLQSADPSGVALKSPAGSVWEVSFD